MNYQDENLDLENGVKAIYRSGWEVGFKRGKAVGIESEKAVCRTLFPLITTILCSLSFLIGFYLG